MHKLKILILIPILSSCTLFNDSDVSLSVRISEIGCVYYQDPIKTEDLAYIEIYNYGSETLELSDLELRCTASKLGSQTLWEGYFTLPEYQLKPGAYTLLRSGAAPAAYDLADYTSADIERLDDYDAGIFYLIQEDYFPYWTNIGFAELVSHGQSVNFVRWGSSSIANPVDGSYENSAPATVFSKPSTYRRSVGRIDENTNTDSGRDWVAYTKSTPGLPNDTVMPDKAK